MIRLQLTKSFLFLQSEVCRLSRRCRERPLTQSCICVERKKKYWSISLFSISRHFSIRLEIFWYLSSFSSPSSIGNISIFTFATFFQIFTFLLNPRISLLEVKTFSLVPYIDLFRWFVWWKMSAKYASFCNHFQSSKY